MLTEKQKAFLERLRKEKDAEERLEGVNVEALDVKEASKLIGELMLLPDKGTEVAEEKEEGGILTTEVSFEEIEKELDKGIEQEFGEEVETPFKETAPKREISDEDLMRRINRETGSMPVERISWKEISVDFLKVRHEQIKEKRFTAEKMSDTHYRVTSGTTIHTEIYRDVEIDPASGDVISCECEMWYFKHSPVNPCIHMVFVHDLLLEQIREKAEKEQRWTGEKKTEQTEDKSEKLEEKIIIIEWGKIPAHVLADKLKKALEYEIVNKEIDGGVAMKHKDTTKTRTAYLNSCECGDWVNRGTSINPCKHMVRIRYTDEEITTMLNTLQVESKGEKIALAKRTEATMPTTISTSIVQPRLCEIGKIKIGKIVEKKKGEKTLRLPMKIDHFQIMSILRDENGNLIRDTKMHEILGKDTPTELDIYLCYDSPDLNMPSYYAYFTQSRLRCMGDGTIAYRIDNGTRTEMECNPRLCEDHRNKLCKPYGRLSVVLTKANRIGGSYVFRTTSWNTLRNILTSMLYIRRITGGILAGIPLTMRLIPTQVRPKDMDHSVTIYMVNIEFNGSMEQLKEEAEREVKRRLQLGMDMRRIEMEEKVKVAEYVREEAEEQAAEIAAEFAPTLDENGGTTAEKKEVEEEK